MGPRVFLGGTRQVGTSGGRRPARPQQCLPGLDMRSKELVFEIPGRHADTANHQVQPLRLSDVPRQRLFAGDAPQLAEPATNGVHNLLDVLDPRMVGTAQPAGVDFLVSDQVADRAIRLGLADIQLSSQCRRGGRVRRVRAPDAYNISIADATPALKVKSCVEAAADECYAKALGRHEEADYRLQKDCGL